MLYPIAIELPANADEAFGVVVPDISGCFSAGDTLDEAIADAREAIELHLQGLSEDGDEIPTATSVASYQAQNEYAGRVWAVVEIDITRYMGKAEKINVTLPGNLIRKIDDLVKATPGESRSGFLARAAIDRLSKFQQASQV